jgi:hypothetical protein
MLAAGAPVALAFAVLHGLGNGIMTIAKGTLPLAIFGPQGYGALTGLILVPTRVLQAAGRWSSAGACSAGAWARCG